MIEWSNPCIFVLKVLIFHDGEILSDSLNKIFYDFGHFSFCDTLLGFRHILISMIDRLPYFSIANLDDIIKHK
jgi:hypothetical protein